ncbi:hypothetical protein HDV00_007780 [Rhizophlyctis rosea]|nr:hypothetical protein HDV00_007780 [Rhizophlyctis rosea]
MDVPQQPTASTNLFSQSEQAAFSAFLDHFGPSSTQLSLTAALSTPSAKPLPPRPTPPEIPPRPIGYGGGASAKKEKRKEREEPESKSPASPRATSATSESADPDQKRPLKQLLTEEEKRANHIESEKKRRLNIRMGFDQLVEMVPTLSQCHRSEALILQKSVEYIENLNKKRSELTTQITSLRARLGEQASDIPTNL